MKVAGKTLKKTTKGKDVKDYEQGKMVCCKQKTFEYVFCKTYDREYEDQMFFERKTGEWFAE